jgi:transcription antitermination factor NusG
MMNAGSRFSAPDAPPADVAQTHSGDAKRWYALYLRSRHEKVVDAKLRDKEIETYCPMIEELHQYSDRKKRVLEPLFRGYLFVRTDLHNKVTILQTGGVVNFVGVGMKPSPIPDIQIANIQIATGSPSRIKREPYLATGEKVMVIAGPFEGIRGYVCAFKASMRVVISVDCIGQSVSVEVSPESLKRLS